jgi:taurine dioxygenase
MTLQVSPQPAPSGALVRGVDLSQPLDTATSAAIRAAWLQHQVLAFVDQTLTLDDLERFALTIGPYGQDPYFASVPGHPHIAQVKREADETSSLFADNFHSDWSFLASPPAATLLYGDIIPPVGGDTLFANQYAAWDALSPAMKALLQPRQGVHSARRGYAKAGRYGEQDKGRSMAIRFDGMPDDEAGPLLQELFQHQARPEFIYTHQWQQGTLLLWDNRCLVHAATGGYDGHRRLLHRITVGERVSG